MSPPVVVLVLSMLLGIQPVTTDLYLPALPAMVAGFGAGMVQAQLTLSALLLAFGISQLFWGPLSDRFGRRPILLVGLAAYTLSAIGAAMAGSMEQLIAWRTLQGAAMGAGVMAARAMVRDLYAPADSARVMSKALSGLGVIACLSAPLGGLMNHLVSWRASLLCLAIFGAASLALVAWRFEESLAKPNPDALRPTDLARNWITISRSPLFWAYALLSTTSYGGLFTFLAASPFVFIQVLKVSPTEYGLLMFSMSFVYTIGTWFCRRLMAKLGVQSAVQWAGLATLLAGAAMAGMGWLGVQSVWAIMLPTYLYMLAHGVHQPCGQSGAVAGFPSMAGAASALSGFCMMLAAFGMGHWLGLRLGDSVLPLTNGMGFWAVCIALTAWVLVRRYGNLNAAPAAASITPPSAAEAANG